jgi:hypothetical protein
MTTGRINQVASTECIHLVALVRSLREHRLAQSHETQSDAEAEPWLASRHSTDHRDQHFTRHSRVSLRFPVAFAHLVSAKRPGSRSDLTSAKARLTVGAAARQLAI